MQNDPYFSRFAHALGYAGLLPIAAAIALLLLQEQWAPLVIRIGAAYGAAILAFLGGIQWGFALTADDAAVRLRRLCVGVLPSLWAAGCLLLPLDLTIPLLILGLIVLLGYETFERPERNTPAWYMPLRLKLTAGLVVGLGLLLLLRP